MPAPPKTDRVGQAIPPDKRVRRAFDGAFGIAAVADAIEDEADDLQDFRLSPSGDRIDDQLIADLRLKAKHIREFCVPYAVCPACEAKRIGKCLACNDRGWMTHSGYKTWKKLCG